MRMGQDNVQPSPVQKVGVNGFNHLLVVYEDNSFILLDQDAKQLLARHQGLGG